MYHKAGSDKHLEKVKHVMKSGGYAHTEKTVKNTIKAVADKEIHKHEKHEHGGKLTKLKHGGCAEGHKSEHRLDKHARGGATKGKKGSHVHVNVIVPQGGKQGIPVPAGVAPMGGSSSVPPVAPPLKGMPAGAPPMGGTGGMPAGAPIGAMKKGGRVMHEEFGSGSGEGRKDKRDSYGQKPKKIKGDHKNSSK